MQSNGFIFSRCLVINKQLVSFEKFHNFMWRGCIAELDSRHKFISTYYAIKMSAHFCFNFSKVRRTRTIFSLTHKHKNKTRVRLICLSFISIVLFETITCKLNKREVESEFIITCMLLYPY